MICVCVIRWKVVAQMTIAFSPDYLLVKVNEDDDHVLSVYLSLFVVLLS